MKTLILFTLFIPLASFCQIDIMQQQDAAYTKPKRFDSSYNYNLTPGWDIREIVGQKLTFLPHSKKYAFYKEEPNFCNCYTEKPIRMRTTESYKDDSMMIGYVKNMGAHQGGSTATSGLSIGNLFHKKDKANDKIQNDNIAAYRASHPFTARDSIIVSNYKPVLLPATWRGAYQGDTYVTDSNAVANKTFIVVEVIDNKMQMNGRRNVQFYAQPEFDVFFKLKTLDNQDSLLLGVSAVRQQNQGPSGVGSFIINGYYEKLKALYTGRKFYARKKVDELMLTTETGEYNLLLDAYNGQKITVDSANEEWLCEKVTFVETTWNKYPVLSLLLKNGERHLALDISRTDLAENSEYFKTEREFTLEKMLAAERAKREEEEREAVRKQEVDDSLNVVKMQRENIAKYGARIGKLINAGQVVIGMTKEQCTKAWGDPSYINTTTTSSYTYEQWVYGSSYLYFKNDILVTIQN